MADEAENTNPENQKPSSSGGGKNPLLTVLVLLNTLMIAAVGFFKYKNHQERENQPTVSVVVEAEMKKSETRPEGTGEAVQKDGILFPLDTFTANLAQGDGPRRFVRMKAVLKFGQDSSEDEFKARKPQIRDTIISTLNSKRPEDILKSEGKEYLKEEIKSAINSFLVDGKVIDVFYVGFQIN